MPTTENGLPPEGTETPKFEHIYNLISHVYGKDKDGNYRFILFGEKSEEHHYVFMYALVAIMIGSALSILSYQMFLRHVIKTYEEETKGEGSELDDDADLAEDSDKDSDAAQSGGLRSRKSTAKKSGSNNRSSTPKPKRSGSGSSKGSSKSPTNRKGSSPRKASSSPKKGMKKA